MNALKRNNYIYIAPLLFLLVMFFIVFNNSSTSSVNESAVVPHKVLVGKNAPENVEPVAMNEQKVAPNIPSTGGIWKEPGDKEIYKQWETEKGYSRETRKDPEYESYSIETLEKLVNSGDVRAMMALGGKRYGGGKKTAYDSAKQMYELAAVYGSTKAINRIGHITFASKLHGSALSVDEERKQWVDTLSWYELAKLRGDRSDLTLLAVNLQSAKVALTSQDWNQARAAAKLMYANMQERRTSLGLGEFDNTEPEAVKIFHDFELEGQNPELLK
jgi:hypothetical protein